MPVDGQTVLVYCLPRASRQLREFETLSRPCSADQCSGVHPLGDSRPRRAVNLISGNFQIALLCVNPEMPAPLGGKPVFDRPWDQFPYARQPVGIAEHDFCSDILELPKQPTRRQPRKHLRKRIIRSISISIEHVLHVEVSICVLLDEVRMSPQFLLGLVPYLTRQLDS